MKTDIYTRIVLTVIAIALWGILLKPIFVTEVSASIGVIDVNIKELGGRRVYDRIDVNLDRINGSTLIGPTLPVEVKK